MVIAVSSLAAPFLVMAIWLGWRYLMMCAVLYLLPALFWLVLLSNSQVC